MPFVQHGVLVAAAVHIYCLLLFVNKIPISFWQRLGQEPSSYQDEPAGCPVVWLILFLIQLHCLYGVVCNCTALGLIVEKRAGFLRKLLRVHHRMPDTDLLRQG